MNFSNLVVNLDIFFLNQFNKNKNKYIILKFVYELEIFDIELDICKILFKLYF